MLWGSKNSVAKIRKKVHNLTFYSTKTFFLPTKPFHFSILLGCPPVRWSQTRPHDCCKKNPRDPVASLAESICPAVRIVQITTAVPLVATISMEFDWPMVS